MQGGRSRQSLIWTHNDTRGGGGDLSVYTTTPLSKFQRSRACGAALLLCNYPESPGANLCGWHKCLPLVFPAYTHTHVHTHCSSGVPCVCNMGGLEVVASASPYTWGEMALMAVVSVGIVLPLTSCSVHCDVFMPPVVLTFSRIICSFCKKLQGYSHSMAASEVFDFNFLYFYSPSSPGFIYWSAH